MENKTYNILWIDDEYETLGGTIGRAKRNGIILHGVKSRNGGLEELKKNYYRYDGILLDAKTFENEDDVRGSEDTLNAIRAKDEINSLQKKFEIFVLTGQAEAFDDKTFHKVFENVYKKGVEAEMERLWADLKAAADRQPDTQLRHDYKNVFELCYPGYIGESLEEDLLYVLKIDEAPKFGPYFNSMRKVVEDLFIAFSRHGLLPEEFVNPTVSLNPSSIFLAGKWKSTHQFNFEHLEGTYLPEHIANSLRNILSVVQPGSHRSYVETYVRKSKTPYLLKSVLFQLLDVLVWFKYYLDSNPKRENWVRM
jgi:hypothetical protein